MVTVNRILCPVDFSEFSRRALDYTIGLARWYEARVTALHVYPIGLATTALPAAAPMVLEPMVLSAVDRGVLRSELGAFVEGERAPDVVIEIEVTEGRIWREIVARAESFQTDLIVLGTHGRSGFERLLLGSVTEQTLRAAPCPVLTVPRAAPDAVPIAPGLFRRILCPTDFSAAGAAAVRWATSLAGEADAELLMFHVLDIPGVAEPEGFPRSTLATYRREYEEWGLARLREAVPHAVRSGCTVREFTAVGSPYKEILGAAAQHGCDLIVMGVARHRGVADRVFGSTTQHVVRAAVCPVLTVREQ